MIGIIGAMEEEIAEIKKLMRIDETKEEYGYLFYKGFINEKDVILLQGGIGKVNAAIATTLLFKLFPVEIVINIGSAGGLNTNQNVGDLVVSSSVIHHDVDVTAFNRELGEVPGMPKYFEADKYLLDIVQQIVKEQNIPAKVGLIASGDQFISKKEQVDYIRSHFKNVLCVEMEAAAVAQVCYVFNKKFIITRSLSDIFNKGDNDIQFDEYLKKASRVSAKMCYEIISRL